MHLDTARIVHPFPSLLVAGVTVGLLALVDRDQPPRTYLVLGGGMLLLQFAIGVTNDVVDVDEDRRLKPWKPLARGDLARSTAFALALGCAAGGLLVTSALPTAAWLVGLLGLTCGLLYDLYLKHTVLSWLPYSVALPLVPLWVFLAIGAWDRLLWWALPLGSVLGLALHLANQASDARRSESQGLPTLLGERRSRTVALGLFAAVAASVVALGGYEDRRNALAPALVALSVLVAAGLTTAFAARAQFAVLAVGAALLALLFFRFA